ncbi:MAG: hypothetical protein BWY74_02377 [Firmicutes bacterium ADurb.Bin419]|nr:MAG: hypothetical protein BWY74_02377 [Firmicutes bacterium ADurb.Bin419]
MSVAATVITPGMDAGEKFSASIELFPAAATTTTFLEKA